MLVALTAGQAFGSVVFFDGTFASANWSEVNILGPGNGSLSFVSTQQQPVGGNPTFWRQVTISLDAQAPFTAIFNLNLNATAFYNPSTQGAITVVDYSEDSIALNDVGNVQASGLLVLQGGSYYIQRNPTLVMPFSSFSNWAPNSAPGLLASDLWEVDLAGQVDPTSNPDFSAAGGVMQLGFYRGSSSGFATGVSVREAGIDNWSVRIVPAPGAACTLALMGALGAARRRRSTRG
ncbi:MAG: hypothetical protein EA423_12340 [Phycisphaerales bacterium]|nr:MAG: hypothetical protein EA423_12340 [Phycisphaerales bacterium]